MTSSLHHAPSRLTPFGSSHVAALSLLLGDLLSVKDNLIIFFFLYNPLSLQVPDTLSQCRFSVSLAAPLLSRQARKYFQTVAFPGEGGILLGGSSGITLIPRRSSILQTWGLRGCAPDQVRYLLYFEKLVSKGNKHSKAPLRCSSS